MERFESVFDTVTELEKDFDVTIEAEEDDDILAVVQGLKEDGTENFDDLHHTNTNHHQCRYRHNVFVNLLMSWRFYHQEHIHD